MSVAQNQQTVKNIKIRKKKWTRDDTELSILALPTSLWYLIFCYLPMFGIILPFLNYKITPNTSFLGSLLRSEWAGLANFKYLFMGGKIWILLRNTIGYNIVFITLGEAPSELPFYVAQGWPGAWTYTKTNDAGEEVKVTGITNPFVGPIFSAGSIMGSMNGIYAGAKNPEKVLQFLELVNTDTKLRDMICYGEEGVNFTYNEDGLVVRDAEKSWPWARYTQGNHAILTAEYTNKDMFKEIEVVNETATPTVLFGFNVDLSNIENEVTLVKGVYGDFASEVLTGAEDPEVIVPRMIDAMKAVGLEKIIEEFQRQVDEFFAE